MSVNNVSKTNTDNTKQVEKMLQLQLMTQMFKEAAGDSPTFDIVMESLMNAMSDNGKNTDLSKLIVGDEDLSKLGYGAGERLNSIAQDLNTDIKSNNLTIDQAVNKAAQKYGVDKNLIMSVIKQESDFDSSATSSAGAMGLMQLMPGTASDLGVSDAYNVDENVDGGTKYLSSLLDMYAGNKKLALAAYNAGPGTLQSRGVDNDSEISRLPSETRNYVSNIMKYYSGK